MNENNSKAPLIRTIISAVAVVIVILSAMEIIPNLIGLCVAAALLCVTSIWNGIDAVKSGRKVSGIVNIVLAVILIAICAVSVLL